jgi:iron(III) transport system substrate-binding protein
MSRSTRSLRSSGPNPLRVPKWGTNPLSVLARLRIIGLLVLLSLAGCSIRPQPTVVVYTSVDQPYSEPVLKMFEDRMGIRARAIYDTEATKTTGLVSRLIAERDQTQADVFWSSEIAQTLWLQEQGVLAPYVSPVASDIPTAYRDPNNYWTGLGLRARILFVNTDLVPKEKYPNSIFDLLDPGWQQGEVGLANPLFGTTATHAAALYAALGADDARGYFEALRDQGTHVVDGNSVVRDMVANGDLKVGLTDTDDAYAAVRQGKPVEVIFPDQEGMGTLLIPNTVALIAGGPNPEQGRALIDYLLSRDVEKALIEAGFFYDSVRSADEVSGVVDMEVVWAEVASQVELAKSDMREIFLR